MIEALASGLAMIVSQALGKPGRITGLSRLTGGTSHDSWAFDAEVDGTSHPLILRRDFGGDRLDLDLATEFALLCRLHGGGLPVPKPFSSGNEDSPIGAAHTICERLSGGDVRKLMAQKMDQSGELGIALVALQAQVHRFDWAASLTGILPHTSLRDQVDHWSGIAARYADGPDPLLAATITWLKQNIPVDAPACLVHGDFKLNNLVAGEDGRIAIIDWELAHIGDPVEDLAWTMLWRTSHDLVGGMLSSKDYLSAYEDATGARIDQDRLRFWQLFALMKLAAIFSKSLKLHADTGHPRPVHVMLIRAMPWLQRQMADQLRAASWRAG